MPRAAVASKRARGFLALAELDSLAAVDALVATLEDPDPDARAAAGLALAAMRDPASSAALARIVATWDDQALAHCRRAALHTLIAFRTEQAAVDLARALATAGPAPVGLPERSALLAVAYAEPTGVAAPRVVRALVTLLSHEGSTVGDRAGALLTLFPSESHGPLARVLRTSSEAEVRRRAAEALGACRQDAAVAALVTALEDQAPGVRAAAARSLGDMRDPATAVALQAAGRDVDEGVRDAARSALGKLGTVATVATVATATSIAAGFGLVAQRSPG